MENAFLGVLAGLMALALGTAVAGTFVVSFMDMPFHVFVGPALATVGVAVVLTLLLGLAGIFRILARKAWPYLRNE